MKKVTILLATIFIVVIARGQVNGVDLENAVQLSDEADLSDYIEQWIKLSEENAYAFAIADIPKPVDYKHLITELDRILVANNLDINKPDTEDDLLPENVKGLTDYSNLAYYVSLGEAEVIRGYFIDDDWGIGIVCNYNTRVLFISKKPD